MTSDRLATNNLHRLCSRRGRVGESGDVSSAAVSLAWGGPAL